MHRIGFRTAGFAAWPIERALRALREIGYNCVELCLEHPETQPADMTAARCRDLAALLGELGLGLSSVSYHGDGRPAEERAENSLLGVEVAERLDCPILVVNTMRCEPGRGDEQTQAAIDLTRRLLSHSQKRVTLAFEPEPGLVISSVEDMMEFWISVGAPRLDLNDRKMLMGERKLTPSEAAAQRVAVNLDIGHAHITEPSVVAAVERLGAMIVHTHIEDVAGKVHKHLVLGAGELDFAAVRAALDRSSYRGDYVVDMFALGDDPAATAQRCYEAMRRWFGWHIGLVADERLWPDVFTR